MEFSFGDEYKDGPLSLGLHKKGSTYDVLTACDCKIVHEDFTKILTCVLAYFKERNASYYHKISHEGYLRHLLVRRAENTGEILVNLVTTSQEEWDLMPLVQEVLGLPLEGKVVGFLHIINDSLADVVKSDETKVLYGQDYFYEELLGLKFKITPFSFFQTNSLGAEVLYSTAREFVGETKDRTIFDLYSGTGTIAQILAPVAKEVIGVEIVEEAVTAAKENAEANGLTNCSFLAGDVLKVIDEIEEKPDFIVLDPPREGIHPKALPKIVDLYRCEKMLYISCKPTSLARDLVEFAKYGYRVEKVCCVDMFPGTVHVETVVLLSKGEVDSKKIRVEFSLEDMDMSEFQDGATYPQIKEYVLEHTGLKVSNLYISQIKRKCGIGVGKNYNLPKSEDSRQPQCPPEKEKAIREAFKHPAKWRFLMDRLISCEFNMDNACVELKFLDGSMIAIDTIAVENEVSDNLYQRSELDYLIYNDPVGYADLILNGDPEIYLKTVTECKPLD
jgi:23S rRNA (uracil-5-)-methyltransferase RumA